MINRGGKKLKVIWFIEYFVWYIRNMNFCKVRILFSMYLKDSGEE